MSTTKERLLALLPTSETGECVEQIALSFEDCLRSADGDLP